jgi:Rrf2 family protein
MGLDSAAMGRPTNTQFAVAVHLLTLLCAEPERVQSSEALSHSVGANAVHARRVLGRLRRAGLVSSRPGNHGGWVPRTHPGAITLADVWRAVYGGDPLLGLHEADPDCQIGQGIQALLLDVDRRAARAVEDELATTTLCDLVRATSPADLLRAG